VSLIECTTPDCGNQTATYLCHQCVDDLQAWLDKIPELVSDLHVTVARLDKIRKQSEGRPGTKTGSAAPINIGAFQIRWYLETITLNAADHAKDPEAATIAKNIRDAVNEGEILVLGPAEPPVDHAKNRERVREIAPAMPTRELIPWLKKNAGIKITGQMIRHYAHKGYLRPIERTPLPTYLPDEVLDVWERHANEAV
jgi:hypothetical protein